MSRNRCGSSFSAWPANGPRSCGRYPVEFLLELLSGEMSEADILADYPDLEPDDLSAAHAYAAKLARIKRFDPLPAA